MNGPVDQTATRDVIIVNRRGLHARAAAKVAALCETMTGDIIFSANGVSATGRSIMGLMLLAAGPGDKLQIAVTGTDAANMVEPLASLVESGFDEDCDGVAS